MPISIKNRYLLTNFILLSAVLVFSSTSLSYWLFDYSWLNQQRVGQLFLAAIGAFAWLVWSLKLSGQCLYPPLLLLIALLLGLVSSLFAQYPDWALKEWAKYTAMLALLLYLGALLHQEEVRQKILVVILVVVSLISTLQFFSFYLASFFTGTREVNAYLMYPGFDNPRFYGQFQVILIPVLHGLFFYRRWHERIFNRWLLTAVLILQWSIVWALAGRGVMLGLLFAFLGLLLTTGLKYKRLLCQAILFLMIGLLLYLLLFLLIPDWVGVSSELPSGLRFGLSKREVLWSGAWEMIRANLLLGVGPLHFSAVWNHIGAHPHQAVLQFAAEWGVPATFMLLLVVARSMCRGMNFVRAHSSSLDAGLWLALLASLTLAQVDGVFAMPYSEGWLALIGGLALARWRHGKVLATVANAWFLNVFWVLVLFAILVIAKILFIDVPALHETTQMFYEKQHIGSPPRFWDQGWIPM